MYVRFCSKQVACLHSDNLTPALWGGHYCHHHVQTRKLGHRKVQELAQGHRQEVVEPASQAGRLGWLLRWRCALLVSQPPPQGLPLDVLLFNSQDGGPVPLCRHTPYAAIQICKCSPLSPQNSLQSSPNTPLSFGLYLPSHLKKSTSFFSFYFDLITRKYQGSLPSSERNSMSPSTSCPIGPNPPPRGAPWLQKAGLGGQGSSPPALFLSLMSWAWPLGHHFEVLMFTFEMIKKSSGYITLKDQSIVNNQKYQWDILLLVKTKFSVIYNTHSFFLRANIKVLLAFQLIPVSCGLILFKFWAYEHVLNRTDKNIAILQYWPCGNLFQEMIEAEAAATAPWSLLLFCITITMHWEKLGRSHCLSIDTPYESNCATLCNARP